MKFKFYVRLFVYVLARLASSCKSGDEKVALITGSTSGIGLSIAEKFASQGKSVVINGFGPQESINQILTNLKKLGNYIFDCIVNGYI